MHGPCLSSEGHGLFVLCSGRTCQFREFQVKKSWKLYWLQGVALVMAASWKKRETGMAGLVPGVVRDHGWEKQLDLHSIFPRWRELLGDDVADHSRPLKVERGVLWVEVENSSWLQQMQYMKLELLDLLNEALKLTRFKDLKMVLPKGKWQPEEKEDARISFVRPSDEDVAAFREQVGCIADEECRESLMQFWYLAHACRRSDK